MKLFMARAKGKFNTKKLQGERTLVVEDQPLISEILIDLLERYGHPSQANSGREALEQINQKAPDVILLDLGLPDSHGLELSMEGGYR